jgi:hypothetical protein
MPEENLVVVPRYISALRLETKAELDFSKVCVMCGGRKHYEKVCLCSEYRCGSFIRLDRFNVQNIWEDTFLNLSKQLCLLTDICLLDVGLQFHPFNRISNLHRSKRILCDYLIGLQVNNDIWSSTCDLWTFWWIHSLIYIVSAMAKDLNIQNHGLSIGPNIKSVVGYLFLSFVRTLIIFFLFL